MKFKTTAIALAVAGTVAAPVVAQAAADEVYASARVGLKYTDTGGVADFDVDSFASRFGMRGETDLGNGLTGFGRYEFGVGESGGAGSTRHLYTGLKGDFGSVLMGRTYHTFYNFVVGPLDIPWWHSGNTMVEYRGRTQDALTYAGGANNFSFGATAYFIRDGEETAPDGLELGVSFPIGDTTLGIAYSNVDVDGAIGSQGSAGNDEDVIGIAWSGIGIGDTSLGVSYMMQDEDTGIVLHWDIGNIYVHAELLSVDSTSAASVSGDSEDKVDLTLGYTQSLGRKTTMYYELNNRDADTGDSDDDYMAVMAVLKYDII